MGPVIPQLVPLVVLVIAWLVVADVRRRRAGKAAGAKAPVTPRPASGRLPWWLAMLLAAAVLAANRAVFDLWYGEPPAIPEPPVLVAFGLLPLLLALLLRPFHPRLRPVSFLLVLVPLLALGTLLQDLLEAFISAAWFTAVRGLEYAFYAGIETLSPQVVWLSFVDDLSLSLDGVAYAWEFRFEDHLVWLVSDFSYLLFVLGPFAAVAALAILRAGGVPRAAGATPLRAASYGGVLMDTVNSETTRLACASALLNGTGFRRRVLDRLRDRHKAVSPEVGLDLRTLVSVCAALERRELGYQLAFSVLVLMALLGLANGLPGPVLLAALGVVVVYLWKSGREKFALAAPFRKDGFDAETAVSSLGGKPDPSIPESALDNDCNVIVYEQFNPFAVAGTVLGSFSFTVDVSRRAPGAAEVRPDVDAAVVYKAVERALASLGLRNLEIRDCLLVHGGDLRGFPALLPDPMGRPRQQLAPEQMQVHLGNDDSRLRHYKWIRVQDWGGELVVSYFLRMHLSGHALYIEVTHCVLSPLADEHRAIDTQLRPSLATRLAWLQVTPFIAPFAAVGATLRLLGRGVTGAFRVLGLEERATRQRIRLDPRYSFGVAESLRASLASGSFLHYFQRTDSDLYDKAIPHQIVQRAADALEGLGVDVSVLREGQTTIINSGVMVQGGNVTAQSLAVGEQSRASVTRTARNLLRRAVPGAREAA